MKEKERNGFMAKTEKEFGQRSNDDIIRNILREYASREYSDLTSVIVS